MTEGVDLERLLPWFSEQVDDVDDHAPLTAELIAGGRSNLTYVIASGEQSWVLRRPPLGHVLESAHDMGREFRVLSALAGTDVPVPRVFALCPDPDLIGAPFYVMEHVQGRVLRNVEQVANLDVAEAGRCSTALGDVLVALHSVDYEARGLGDFGRPEGFLARNVSRWNKQWDANRTRTMPAVDEIGRRLKQAVPESGPPAVIHGDYRLDNTMLALEDAGRVVAVLDWEMSTIGDPLTDLGLLAVYWGDVLPPDAIGVPLSHVPGFGSTDAMVERYAEASGRAVDELEFYIVLALYKLAVILEGINKRFQMGQTVGGGFDGLGDVVSILGDIALERASSAPNHRLRG